jgi:hypothetical protein
LFCFTVYYYNIHANLEKSTSGQASGRLEPQFERPNRIWRIISIGLNRREIC